jgi:hypothetical protein
VEREDADERARSRPGRRCVLIDGDAFRLLREAVARTVANWAAWTFS